MFFLHYGFPLMFSNQKRLKKKIGSLWLECNAKKCMVASSFFMGYWSHRLLWVIAPPHVRLGHLPRFSLGEVCVCGGVMGLYNDGDHSVGGQIPRLQSG